MPKSAWGLGGVGAEMLPGSGLPTPKQGKARTGEKQKVLADVGVGERRPRAGDTIKGATRRARSRSQAGAHASRCLSSPGVATGAGGRVPLFAASETDPRRGTHRAPCSPLARCLPPPLPFTVLEGPSFSQSCTHPQAAEERLG